MKMALEVKTNKRALRPTRDDVIIYDGKDWYITTKQDLFKEYEEKLDAKVKACDEKLTAITNFQTEISRQMVEYGNLIKELVQKENK